jgi:hypothetical protein
MRLSVRPEKSSRRYLSRPVVLVQLRCISVILDSRPVKDPPTSARYAPSCCHREPFPRARVVALTSHSPGLSTSFPSARSSTSPYYGLEKRRIATMLDTVLLFVVPVAFLLLLLTAQRLKLFPRFLQLIRHPRMAPTQFHLGDPHVLFPAPETPHRTTDRRTKNIDSRYEFLRPLGLGCEGCTSVYRDHAHGGRPVVIKEFFAGVRQNPLPSHLAAHFAGKEWWPAEIPATLYFGNWDAPGEFEAGVDHRRKLGGLTYAVDYFWIEDYGWMLVTPFLRCGTLETLAELVRRRGLTPTEVDGVYRRRFRGVLEALAKMHEHGFSHDDVKMDNIFVSETGAFLLGDLGNVREHEHSFHVHTPDIHTGLADYRQGDTERAVRSYFSFLRVACRDSRVFDRQFRESDEEWNHFFWRYKRARYTARELLQDPFWAEGEGWPEEKCVQFEWELEEMRKQLTQWKRGEAAKPQWEVAAKREGTTREERVEAKKIDLELACISPSCLERVLLPWRRKLSHSCYCV